MIERVQYTPEDLDQSGYPVLTEESYIDEDGWLWDSQREDANVLLWVPKENRQMFPLPPIITVIHRKVTKIDFSRFVHGGNWAECMHVC